MRTTRRDFFATTSLALGGAFYPSRPVWRLITPKMEAMPAAAFVSEAMPTEHLRTCATAAIDAAREAGADYADVRVAERIQCEIAASGGVAIVTAFEIVPQFMYGVRALVNGAWAFTHGVTPSVDALAQSARDAVATARGYVSLNGAGANKAHVELAPAPVVTGEWATPITLDPFAAPLGDQAALLSACCNAVSRVRNADIMSAFTWTRETRIFASTEGSLVTQRFHTQEPNIYVSGDLPAIGIITLPQVLWPVSGGYEWVTRPSLQDELKQLAEESVRYLTLPRRMLEVGRYPVVFDGRTLGATFSRTMGCALELDRVLGDEIGTSGGSYLSPPEATLGTQVTSPLLTVTANRALPSITAVKWDDDGVEAREFALITQGRLVNYCSSRATAARLEMSASSARQSSPQPSTGCAVAPAADSLVTVRVPHLVIAPATTQAEFEDLYKDITRGLLIVNGRYVSVDRQMTSAFLTSPGAMFEIERGKIVRRIEGNGLQLSTARLWRQSLAALGGPNTVQQGAIRLTKGLPEVEAWQSLRAPAGLFKDVDVVSTRIRL